MGVRVPNFVPDGLNRACRWPPVEDGGSSWGIPLVPPEVSTSSPGFTRQAVGIRLGGAFSTSAVGPTGGS
jgi:hypothetical protein